MAYEQPSHLAQSRPLDEPNTDIGHVFDYLFLLGQIASTPTSKTFWAQCLLDTRRCENMLTLSTPAKV